ncbi:MAG: type II toxin-antitoxin system VapC family toxin [Caulobacteraceae bacterium]
MTARPILLDTHAIIWMPDAGKLSAAAEGILLEAQQLDTPVFISPISAWEIGLLVARGKIALPVSPGVWLKAMTDSGLAWAGLPPDVLISSSFLPGDIHGDPADRILVSTARTYGYRLMTRDRRLLDYGAAGHVQVIAC